MDASQQILRGTNIEVRRSCGEFGFDDGDFICECGRNDCNEVISLSVEEFDTFCATANGTPLVAKIHR
jgi:hypothetical protein